MTVLVVHHRVRDFDAWKPVFDEHETSRREHRARRHWVYRTADDPNDVIVAVEFVSAEDARAFLEDPSLREAMQRGGVEGEPDVHLRERVEAFDY
jgi:heme-degrading monooxygenase HmoA